ncbi:MAG: FAD-binding oxidoreductase [Alphaproteobacteria bacterium]|nr:FAD-binding oxidoreductase [Alphaproteobacteria bacterium]
MTRLFGPRDITVIGSEIVSLYIALFLQKEGHRVTFISKKSINEIITQKNAGIIDPYFCIPEYLSYSLSKIFWSVFDPALYNSFQWNFIPYFFNWINQTKKNKKKKKLNYILLSLHELLSRSIHTYDTLFQTYPRLQSLVDQKGHILAYKDQTKVNQYFAYISQKKLNTSNLEIIDKENIKHILPELASIFDFCLFLPKTYHVINNYNFIQNIFDMFQNIGGKFINDTVIKFDIGVLGPKKIITPTTYIDCDTVVIGDGIDTKNLCNQLNYFPNIFTQKEYNITFHNSSIELALPISIPELGLHAVSNDNGFMLTGGYEWSSFNTVPNFRRAHTLLKIGKKIFPNLEISNRSDHCDINIFTEDLLPIISNSSYHRNVFFAFAHGSLGLTLAPVTAQLITDLIADRDPGFDINPYHIDRF